MKAKPGVELKEGQYYINGEPFFMYSGELHYFRIPASAWEDRLKKAKQLGLNTVSSYIPWIWHEPREGQFDFTGQTHPERNLEKFLKLVGKYGLKFLARPGPINHGEIKNGGLPQWLLEKPGGICVRRADGRPCDCIWLPSFYKPLYQEAVRSWYGAVMPILVKYQASQGGPVIQTQLDNEIHMQNWLGKVADYNPEATARYQVFLKAGYGDLEKLNRVYKTAYTDFSQVQQPAGDPEKEAWPRLWDWARYYRDHYAGYFEFLARLAREKHGLETALSANIAQYVDFNMYGRGWESMANTNVFREFASQVPQVIFGGAFQMRHLDFENFHDIIYSIKAMRNISSSAVPVNCAELQVGVINDRPRIYPSDVELNLKTAVAHGLNGVNGYMTFGGKSPDEIEMRGNYHEWQAPVDASGNWREHAEPLRRFGKFVKTFGKILSRTQTSPDLTLGFDSHYYFTEFLEGGFYDRVQKERNLQFFDGSARILELLGFNTDLMDLERASLEEIQTRPVIWLFTLDFMSRPVMEKIAAYVQNGGRIILNPRFPVKDERMNADPYLLEQLGIQVEAVRPMSERNLFKYQKMQYMVESDMTLFKEEGVEVLLRNQDGRACGIRRSVGRGEVLAIGFGLYHQYDYMVELLKDLTSRFGLFPVIKKDNWEVHAALLSHEGTGWLYMANFHDAPRTLKVEFAWPLAHKKKVFPPQGRLRLPNRSAYFFPVYLPLTETMAIADTTCEVVDFNFRKKSQTLELVIRGLPGQSTQMIIATSNRIRKIRLDDKSLNFKKAKDKIRLVFTASGELQKITVQL